MYAAGTIQNTAPTVEKVRFVMDTLLHFRPGKLEIPCRRMCAFFGLLFFARHTIPLSLARYFAALRYFRQLPADYDAPAPALSDTVRAQLVDLAKIHQSRSHRRTH